MPPNLRINGINDYNKVGEFKYIRSFQKDL